MSVEDNRVMYAYGALSDSRLSDCTRAHGIAIASHCIASRHNSNSSNNSN